MKRDLGNGFKPFPNKPWFLRVCSKSLLKTLWEKDKLLVTSNLSLSHNVFYPSGELSDIFIKFEIVVCKRSQFGRVQNLSFEKGLNEVKDDLDQGSDCTFCAVLPLSLLPAK